MILCDGVGDLFELGNFIIEENMMKIYKLNIDDFIYVMNVVIQFSVVNCFYDFGIFFCKNKKLIIDMFDFNWIMSVFFKEVESFLFFVLNY